MGIFDFLFGRKNDRQPAQPNYPATGATSRLSNEQALARYRYLVNTAPPETIEHAHAEAFAQMTPEQRAYAQRELANELPSHERAAMPQSDDPQTLARMATRAELRQPGSMERIFNRADGPGMGGMLAGSFLGTLLGGVVGSMAAAAIMESFAPDELAGGIVEDLGIEEATSDFADFGGDFSGDDLGGDFDGGDW